MFLNLKQLPKSMFSEGHGSSKVGYRKLCQRSEDSHACCMNCVCCIVRAWASCIRDCVAPKGEKNPYADKCFLYSSAYENIIKMKSTLSQTNKQKTQTTTKKTWSPQICREIGESGKYVEKLKKPKHEVLTYMRIHPSLQHANMEVQYKI